MRGALEAVTQFGIRPDGIFADSETSDWTVSFHGTAALFAASEPVWRTACEGRFDARVLSPEDTHHMMLECIDSKEYVRVFGHKDREALPSS